ncbi:MAG: Hsp20/alpha crystallin family protein, partial [Segetibacter sp.]|nr:Hsp20/alpha crystallin family protein [Segetibacter sp.]
MSCFCKYCRHNVFFSSTKLAKFPKKSIGILFGQANETKKFKTMILTKTHPASRNLNNVFDELFNSLPSNWNKPANEYASVPVNITEVDNGYNVEVLAPGRNKEDFSVKL